MAILPTLTSFKFFNKTGDAYNFYIDPVLGYFTGQINLAAISINLFECETIYVLQEVESNFGQPSLVYPMTTNPASRSKITAKIASSDPEFKLFDVNSSDANQASIDFLTTKDLQLDFDPASTVNSVTDRVITSMGRNVAARVDVAFSAETEENYTDVLVLSMGATILAKIELYCEAIGEDDRLTNHLYNFGDLISTKDEYIFRESDIEEELPNYKLLNEKRKEYLLDLKNIQKYSSSYKGIYHVLFFFGYYDLQLKELWFNNVDKRFFYQEADLAEKVFNDTGVTDANRHLEKTSFFGLFYEINKTTGLADANGLPELVDNFAFTDKEIVIKLFGLKNWLKDRNIGGVSRVMDIIGEITHYSQLKIRYWSDQSTTFYYNQNQEVKFEADKTEIFIEDLRPHLNDFSQCTLSPDDDLSNISPELMNQCFIGYFANSYQLTPQYTDAPDVPIGAILKLYNRSFGLTWKDASISWDDILKLGLDLTWENFDHLNFYKIEWFIKRRVDASDPRQWQTVVGGKPSEVAEPAIFIPYEGEYDVTLTLHSYNGGSVKLRKDKYVRVMARQADFFAFYKFHEPDLQIWDTCRLSWDKITSDWKSPVYDNEAFQVLKDEIGTEPLKIANYLPNLSSVDRARKFDNPTWHDMKNLSWDDAYYLTWDDLLYKPAKNASFTINRIDSGGKMQIGKDLITIPNDFNFADFGRLVTLLSSLSVVDYPSVALFIYKEHIIGTRRFMEGLAIDNTNANVVIAGSPGFEITTDIIIENWNDLDKTPFGDDTWASTSIIWDAAGVVGKAKAVNEPFNWNNIRIYKNNFDVVIGIPVFFNFSNSKMAGKTNATWTITDKDGVVVYSTKIPNFCYRFDAHGIYTMSCQIEDNKGNTSTTTKRNMINVLKAHQMHTKLRLGTVPNAAMGAFDLSFDLSFL